MKTILSTAILWWLKLAAQLQLAKVRPQIIGVTGSAGKSSAVKAIATVLSTKYTIKYSKKGNSETGIPFEILDIPVETYTGFEWISVCLLAGWHLLTRWPKYDVFIAEMGIDSEKSPKNMTYLLSILQPDIGVFLSVNAVHGANFSGDDIVQSIANEKAKLLTSLHESGTAIYSIDYPEILRAVEKVKAHKKTFSADNKQSTLRLTSYAVSLRGTTYTFLHEGNTYTLHFDHQLHFRQTFGTFASAILTGLEFKISIGESIAALQSKFTVPPGRLSLIEGIQHSWILDSSYNSSLGPTTAALEMLGALKGRKIAVLGDMRELGKQTRADHEQLAHIAVQHTDLIFLIGPSTQEFTLPKLLSLGFPKEHVHSFTNTYQAVEPLKKVIQTGDIILVKGSQNTLFLEIIVKALMADPSQAPHVLARQTPYWENQRQQMKISDS